MNASDITYILRRWQFRFASEAKLQESIAKALTLSDVAFQREFVLSPQDRVDFFINGLAMECKIDGPFTAVARQLHRYAQHDAVTSILLVTTRAQHINMPTAINEKPVTVYYLVGSVF